MRKILKINIVLLLVLIAGCATLNLNPTGHTAYYDALSFYNTSWESYHKVWLTLDEEKKTEWVEKYHPIFLEAGNYIEMWAKAIGDPQMPIDWVFVEDQVENILIQLAIGDK